MRKEKVVTVGDRTVTIKEVSPRMVIQSFGADDGPAAGISCLIMDCCSLDKDELQEMYGSELEQLWQAFQEVNSFFFALASKLGLDAIITEMGQKIVAEMGQNFATTFGEVFASLSKQDTVSTTP